MTNQEVINFLDQARKILLDDKSWIESVTQPINEAFDMAISALQAQDATDINVGGMIYRQAAISTVKKHYRVDNDLLEVIVYQLENLPSAQPEWKSVWHKTYNEGFPTESDQVLVTDGKNFWVDESVSNDVGFEWACFDGCWENTEWAYFNDLRRISAQPEIIHCGECCHFGNCGIVEAAMSGENFYCGLAERREDGKTD